MSRVDEMKRYIDQAVQTAFEAGRLSYAQTQKDAYKATERRLYAIPILKARLIEEQDHLAELISSQAPEKISRSLDVVRLRRGGRRLSDEDLLKAQIQYSESMIASMEHEIGEVENGLERIRPDFYYRTVPMKYFDGLTDDIAAEILKCDPSTIRRNRSRLVKYIAIWFYGVTAL
jgi:hypothetical protein